MLVKWSEGRFCWVFCFFFGGGEGCREGVGGVFFFFLRLGFLVILVVLLG